MSRLGLKVIISYIIIVVISTYIFMVKVGDSLLEIFDNKNEVEVMNTVDRVNTFIKKSFEEKDTSENYGEEGYNKLSYVDNKLKINIGDSQYSIDVNYLNSVIGNDISIFFLDEDSKIVYKSKNYKDIFFPEDYELYSTNRMPLKIGDKIVGYYTLKLSDQVFLINRSRIFNAFFRAFLITMLIALMIAFVFEMSIVSPVQKLRKNIKNFSLDREFDWEDIKTDDELSDVNKEFLNMGQKLKELNQKQKTFFQNTSHELKTPLMTIQGYAEAIKDGVLENKKQGLDIIISESKRLKDTINSIIYISNMLEKDVNDIENYEDINIYELMEKIKKNFEYINVEGKQIKIYNLSDKNISITIDKSKLERAISNLISNATRYAKTKIIFEAYINKNDLIIRVSDDGNGFNEGDESRLFDRFYKGKGGKTGLGLSIVKSIVDSFSGEIIAYNASKNGGAVFQIKLKNEMFNVVKMNDIEEKV